MLEYCCNIPLRITLLEENSLIYVDSQDHEGLDTVDSLSKQIQSVAVVLLRKDLSDSNDDILKEFTSVFSEDELSIPNSLRSLRQWAASVPDLLTNERIYDRVNQCRINVFITLKNFLDSLLLWLFNKNCITKDWYSLPVNIQSNVILSLSICFQVIINLLSESIHSVETFNANSLLTILLSGSRPLILLTDYGMVLWRDKCHCVNHNRVSSHYSYLLYLLLLRIEQTGDKMHEYVLNNILSKIMQNQSVISALMIGACEPSENSSVPAKQLHYQLLVTQLATHLAKYTIPSSEKTFSNIGEFVSFVVNITGVALLLLSQDQTDQLSSSSQTQCVVGRILPTSVNSCLGYWLSFLATLRASEMADVMDIFLLDLSQLSVSWIKELIEYSPADEIGLGLGRKNSDCFPTNYFPFAPLRALVHILASIAFSSLNPEVMSSLAKEEHCSDSDKLPCDELQSLSISQDNGDSLITEKKMSISQECAGQLWKLLCNILVGLHYGIVKIEESYNISDSLEGNLPLRNDPVEVKDFKVHASRLAKKMVLLPRTSAFSLVQAVGFKQDVIRCMVGLITQFPQLSLALAQHKFNISEYLTSRTSINIDGDNNTSNSPSSSSSSLMSSTTSFLSAFEVILDSTNRDPFNSFCAEWAILLIRLALKSNHPDSSEAISILSSKLNGLKGIP
ncbi:unnamed protein product [Trichobilharzia szidati]|nr:unnamed protein product [Trichobilharzia szidati]